MKMFLAKRLRCIFGCRSPAFGIYWMPKGCVCYPNKLQVLCAQHVINAEPITSMRKIVEFFKLIPYKAMNDDRLERD